MPFVLFQTWMDLEMMILSEVSQTEKDMPYNITYTRNLKYNTNEFIYKAETDSQTKTLVVAQGEDGLGIWGPQSL